MMDLIIHRAELPSYSEEELLAQGEARLEKLTRAVRDALLYSLGASES